MVGGSAALRTTLEETYLKEHRGQSANVTEPAESEAPPEKKLAYRAALSPACRRDSLSFSLSRFGSLESTRGVCLSGI